MISVVISSYKPLLFQRVSENIKDTIGVECEIVLIKNDAQYSICEAYNMGVAKAKFPYLCFVHEDVLFKTKDWGKRLISIMNDDSSIGLIGIAGTKFRSTYPSAIGQGPGLSQFLRGHIYHWDKYKDFDSSISKNDIEDVVCIDGVFMFTKNEIFEHCRFDDKLLTHFHGYDIDFSLQVFFQSYRVVVDRSTLIAHYSDGNYSIENTVSNRKVAKKWMRKLPVATNDTHLSKLKLYRLDVINWIYFFYTAFMRKLNSKH
ncbi:MAG: glycosyltransferase [Paludibacter sp.]